MRIIAGKARGHTLKCPRGVRTRPTPDRVREAVFSIIGDRVEGIRVADLFAGTGALGLEALSRGAAGAVFVEKNPAALRCLRENIRSCGFSDMADVVSAPVLPFLRTSGLPADTGLIFADPPYRGDEGTKTLLALAKHAKSLPGSIVVLEHPSGREPDRIPGEMVVRDRRRYGDTGIMFLTIKNQGD